MAGTRSVHGNVGHAFSISFEAKTYEFISLTGEAELLGRGADNTCGTIGLDGYRSLLNAVFHCKDVDRNLYLLSVPKDAGKGGDNHQWILNGDGLFSVSVSALMCGNEHYAYASNVHGKFQFQNVRSLGLEGPGFQEQHGGVEAVVLAGALYGILVTADSGKR